MFCSPKNCCVLVNQFPTGSAGTSRLTISLPAGPTNGSLRTRKDVALNMAQGGVRVASSFQAHSSLSVGAPMQAHRGIFNGVVKRDHALVLSMRDSVGLNMIITSM